MKIQYEIFYIFRDLTVYMKTKHFFSIYISCKFRRKPSILIPDLYFYSIEIQTTINKKNSRKICEKTTIFLKDFEFFSELFFFLI
jgi:hypothetical protein